MKNKLYLPLLVVALLFLVVWTGYGQGQRLNAGPARETWEYDILYNGAGINPAFQQQLNQRGAQGWELAAVAGDFYYFKRSR